jgi:hypothetical protein
MKALETLTQDEDAYLYDVISNCSRHLGLRGLTRIAASSQQLGHSCSTIINRDAMQLAVSAVEGAKECAEAVKAKQAAHASGEDSRAWLLVVEETRALFTQHAQHLQDLVQLLQLKPTVVAKGSLVDCLLHTCVVPKHLAVQLVAAGVRITYAQLLCATNSMVKDIEVWVQAQEQLRITTDIPPAAFAVCCDTWDLSTKLVSAAAHRCCCCSLVPV